MRAAKGKSPLGPEADEQLECSEAPPAAATEAGAEAAGGLHSTGAANCAELASPGGGASVLSGGDRGGGGGGDGGAAPPPWALQGQGSMSDAEMQQVLSSLWQQGSPGWQVAGQ
jgi:hypothetical protein